MKQPLIVLTGPTAVGKTALSIRLAKAIGGEIVSADSMQVYRHMDIGSAKVTPGEMDGVPHYLIDVLDPRDSFNVVTFQQMAKEALREIYSHGRILSLPAEPAFIYRPCCTTLILKKMRTAALSAGNWKPWLRGRERGLPSSFMPCSARWTRRQPPKSMPTI